jgi:hypothetical protein
VCSSDLGQIRSAVISSHCLLAVLRWKRFAMHTAGARDHSTRAGPILILLATLIHSGHRYVRLASLSFCHSHLPNNHSGFVEPWEILATHFCCLATYPERNRHA